MLLCKENLSLRAWVNLMYTFSAATFDYVHCIFELQLRFLFIMNVFFWGGVQKYRIFLLWLYYRLHIFYFCILRLSILYLYIYIYIYMYIGSEFLLNFIFNHSNNAYNYAMLISIFQSFPKRGESPCGIATYVLDCDIEVCKFKLQSYHYIHFQTMNSLIPPAMS